MRHEVVYVLRFKPQPVHEFPHSFGDMLEIGRFACEPAAVTWIGLRVPSPEVRGVRRDGAPAFKLGDYIILAEDESTGSVSNEEVKLAPWFSA